GSSSHGLLLGESPPGRATGCASGDDIQAPPWRRRAPPAGWRPSPPRSPVWRQASCLVSWWCPCRQCWPRRRRGCLRRRQRTPAQQWRTGAWTRAGASTTSCTWARTAATSTNRLTSTGTQGRHRYACADPGQIHPRPMIGVHALLSWPGGGQIQDQRMCTAGALLRYNRCLWVLRHAPDQRRAAFVGGHHYPTLLLTNHREPEMLAPPLRQPPRPRVSRRHADIPLQAFQDTQAQFAWLERRRVLHHFLVPYFDVNIGNAIKNQGSMNHYQSYHMQMLVREGDKVVDAGANLGCYTVALAQAVGPSGRVFAFEPFRWLHQVLTANVALNGLTNVWPVQAALGRAREILPLVPPQLRFFSSPGGVHVQNQSEQIAGMRQHESFHRLYDLLAREPEHVRVVRLDDLLLDAEESQWWGLPAPVEDVRLLK
ncbi:unnamed protein product, partial [Prorocentrum cordatum]